MQTAFSEPKAADYSVKPDFVLSLKEEDFKMKDFEDTARQAVPKLPDFDMKMLPTFKDLPLMQPTGHQSVNLGGV